MRKFISIGSDRNIFKDGSDVLKRQIEYGKRYDEFVIVIFALKKKYSDFFDFKRDKNNLLFKSVANVKIYSTNSSSKLFYIFDAYKIIKSLIDKNSLKSDDFLISAQDPFETGIVAWLIARRNKLPLQLQIHTDLFSPYFIKENFLNKLRIIIATFLLPKADFIRVVSKRISDSLISRLDIDRDKVEIKPIDIDLVSIKSLSVKDNLRNKYPQFRKIILMASRLSLEKNISFALNVFFKIIGNRKDIGLIIVGSGKESDKLKKMVKEMKFESNVIFIDWIDSDILYGYYKTADLFLNTSLYEGYGLTLIEAYTAGCKVISSDVGVANEITGIDICPINDERCFVNKITEYIK